MQIKAAEIARVLGISKATVSLALNNKPGVSEEKRALIKACKETLERGEKWFPENGLSGISVPRQTGLEIKVLKVSRGLKNVLGAEIDLWTDVNEVFEFYTRQRGYSLGIMYFDILSDSSERLKEECNQEKVAGVIVLGTELYPEDVTLLKTIEKPVVVYDADIDCPDFPAVMVNNRQGVSLAVSHFWNSGIRDIRYLGNSLHMYNYESRRRGFIEAMERLDVYDAKNRITGIGSSIEEVYQTAKTYFQNNPLPEGLIMDSYHISIGVIRALNELKRRIPEDISLIGIDKLPEYLTGNRNMTAIRIPHTERAYWVVQFLFRELEASSNIKPKLYMNCELLEGDTVAHY